MAVLRAVPAAVRRQSLAATAVVAAAAWLAMSELNRLVTAIPDADGRTRGLSALVGPGAFGERDAWAIWAAGVADVRGLLVVHSLVDVPFFLALAALLARATPGAGRVHRLLALYVAAEVVELLLLLAGAAALDESGVPAGLSVAVAAATTAKWVLLALALAVAVGNRPLRGQWRTTVRRVWNGLFFQRLSLLVVGLLAALACLPLPDIWEQLPDVQRGWTDGGRGAAHLAAAVVANLLLTTGLVLLGRQRAERAHALYATGDGYLPRAGPQYRWWVVPPLVVGGAGLLLLRADLVDLALLGWFVGVPLALAALSWLLDALRPDPPDAPLPADPQRAADIRRAGDALALALPVVACLALVRSFTAPIAAALVDDAEGVPGAWGAQLELLLLGPPLALVAVRWGPVLIERAAGRTGLLGRLLTPEEHSAFRSRTAARLVPLLFWWLSLAVLTALVLAPISLGRWLGVVATMLLGVGGWVLLLGFVQVRLQGRRPLRVFRLVGMRASPLLAVLVAIAYLGSLGGGDRDLHVLRSQGVQPAPPPLERVLAGWAGRAGACAREVPGSDRRVRPMVLVAASGGGIRAAYWTASGLDRLYGSGFCARTSVALSSGVSGGSVGLALSRDAGATEVAARLAGPDDLSAAIAGLLAGDMVGGVTGLRAPAVLDGSRNWLDRAGLMETVWESKAPGLREPFATLGGGPAGALLLNSAAAGVGCRVLVSQTRLDDPAQTGARSGGPAPGDSAEAGAGDTSGDDAEQAATRCTSVSDLPASSLSLRSLYPPGCAVPGLRLSTAAMLSARFPTVTPGARLPVAAEACRPTDVQLVDGGYAESSGVGTLADLAPRVAAQARVHNARSRTVVVPVVVYLEDAARADLAPRPPALAPEALVPLAGRGAKAAQTSSGAWLQRASAALAHVCPAGDAGCRAAVDAVRVRLTGGVVVVAPVTRPGVDAPLGWTLSQASLTRLSEAMDDQATPGCTKVDGYACLHDLLQVLDRQAPLR